MCASRVWASMAPKIAFLCVMALGAGTAAQDRSKYRIVVDPADESGYDAGIGISTLIKIKILPKTGIDLNPVTSSGFLNAFSLVDRGHAEFAILEADWSDLAPDADNPQQNEVSHSVQTVAILWGGDQQPATTLVASSSVNRSAVYMVTKAIFEHLPYLVGIEAEFSQTSIERAIATRTLPHHPGALDYLEEISARPPLAASEQVAVEGEKTTPSPDARSFAILFDFDTSNLPADAAVTIEEIERFAETLESPTISVSGYTDRIGPTEYNLSLAQRRADAVVQALQSRDLNAQSIDATAYGEQSPLVSTGDEVGDDRNRRVEVLVEGSSTPNTPSDRSRLGDGLVPVKKQRPTF